MRSMLALLLPLALTLPAVAGGVDNFLKICSLQADPAACDADAKQFARMYTAALKRDYTSQRNVAYIFSYGRSEAVQKDPVQGCAWRLVIIASGSPKVDGGDRMNLDTECGRLSATELASAKARALAIGRTIAAGGEKPTPAAKGKKPAKELDSEAEPL